ncbi:MAG: protein kinase domain-containing protein [Candidatus Acidiferrales bacterium]
MTLTSGTKLGPYEIQSPLGAGGMGEVYRARDTRLGRDVAVKVLPAAFATDVDRLRRFEQEARAVGSLNHPNILAIHDIGTHGGAPFLVTELLEGETLRERLQGGALALRKGLDISIQAARGIAAAHEKGIIHRDLKPANIFLTSDGRVKILDFGLAKLTRSEGVDLSDSQSPTRTLEDAAHTESGVVLGTMGYMSPEQVRGKPADARTDIFALGTILYEMLSGERAFRRESSAETMAAILNDEPPELAGEGKKIPAAVERIVRHCLEKNPAERFQSARDVAFDLESLSGISTTSAAAMAGAPSKRIAASRWLAYALGVVAAVSVGVATRLLVTRPAAPAPVVSAILAPSPNVTVVTMGDSGGAPAISRDGRNLVFVGAVEGKQMLFVRSLSGGAARPLTGTDGGKFPFWSSDGQSIGFFADGQLKRVDLSGGPPTILTPAADGRGGTWAGDTILFTPDVFDVIYRVPATGGKASAVTQMDRSLHTTHRWPYFLPDGKHLLYLAANHLSDKEGNTAIYSASVEGGESKLVLRSNGSVVVASGKLLFFRDGTLMAQDFDAREMKLSETAAVPLVEVLRESGNWEVMVSASENGVLVYQGGGDLKGAIRWLDRSGHNLVPDLGSADLEAMRLSPDGSRAAVLQNEGPNRSLYVWDLKTGARTRLTFGSEAYPAVWSPDGKRVIYTAAPSGAHEYNLYSQAADGSGEPNVLFSSDTNNGPADCTRDGRYVIFSQGEFGSQRIWILPLFGDRKPFLLFPHTDINHFDGRVSPDGRWISYMARESGPQQLFVTSFPSGAGKWQVGSLAVDSHSWSADGKELRILWQNGNLGAASIEATDGSFVVTRIRTLFHSPFANRGLGSIFDVEGKAGGRFIGELAPDTNSLPLNVVANWTEGLKKQ